MRKLTRKNLDELAKVIPVLNKRLQRNYIGGCKHSCVFNCFDYLDGDLYDSCHYYKLTSGNLGYVPDDGGNVNTSDISQIGSYGSFCVKELDISNGLHMTSGGSTLGGEKIIMTFNIGKQGHAVVVTGYEYDGNNLMIKYYDPTAKKHGSRANGDYSALYSVGPLYIDTPITGTVVDDVSGNMNNPSYA